MTIRPVDELAEVADPAWPELRALFDSAGPSVSVLPGDPERCRTVLHGLQVTARSALGAMALNCGGVTAGDGWLRLLGGGWAPLPDLAMANGLGPPDPGRAPPPWLIVAWDVLGGQFAVDGGGLGVGLGEVCYFGPDTLRWTGLGVGHFDFLCWAAGPGLDGFYEDLRWDGWAGEVGEIRLDQGLSFYPPLFSREAADRSACSRRPVPAVELFAFHHDMARQLGPPG